MKPQTKVALEQIRQLDRAAWDALDARAAEQGVGGSRWEEAWLAASTGYAAGSRAYRDAIVQSATVRAAAAVAGAVAAVEADGALSVADSGVLLGGGSFGFLGWNPRPIPQPVLDLARG